MRRVRASGRFAAFTRDEFAADRKRQRIECRKHLGVCPRPEPLTPDGWQTDSEWIGGAQDGFARDDSTTARGCGIGPPIPRRMC